MSYSTHTWEHGGETYRGTPLRNFDLEGHQDFGRPFYEVIGMTEERANEIDAEIKLEQLRIARNQKLTETDWWAVGDRTMTQEQTDYRQALRDITDTYSSLEDVVWPDKPEI